MTLTIRIPSLAAVLALSASFSEAFVPHASFVTKRHDKIGDVVALNSGEDIPPGWEGGFPDSNPAFAYPKPSPDLSSLDVLGNMDNIDKLDRMQKVLWPQFSWLTVPGDPSSRCYQMFAPDISRLGYDKTGRVYSIICPQQGFGTNKLGNLNVEVTVTGQRGWCNETARTVSADMSVTGVIWLSPSTHGWSLIKFLAKVMTPFGPFPFSKKDAINVTTYHRGKPYEPLFPLINGTDQRFMIPKFAQHWDEAYGVAYLDVEIGPIIKTGHPKVDAFNQMILDVFNLGSGKILEDGNILSWNVWFDAPEIVDREEWQAHADYWRESLQVNHTSPYGDGVAAKFYDGTDFKPLKYILQQETKLIRRFIINHIFNPKTNKLYDDIKIADDETASRGARQFISLPGKATDELDAVESYFRDFLESSNYIDDDED